MMATVLGLYDDLDGLYKAIDVLEKEGLGDDISHVFEGNEGEGASDAGGDPDQEVSNEGLLGTTQTIGAGGVANRGGSTHPMTVDLQGTLSRLDGLGEEGDFFRNSVQHGGKLVMLDTGDAGRVVEVLKETGAERIHDPRDT